MSDSNLERIQQRAAELAERQNARLDAERAPRQARRMTREEARRVETSGDIVALYEAGRPAEARALRAQVDRALRHDKPRQPRQPTQLERDAEIGAQLRLRAQQQAVLEQLNAKAERAVELLGELEYSDFDEAELPSEFIDLVSELRQSQPGQALLEQIAEEGGADEVDSALRAIDAVEAYRAHQAHAEEQDRWAVPKAAVVAEVGRLLDLNPHVPIEVASRYLVQTLAQLDDQSEPVSEEVAKDLGLRVMRAADADVASENIVPRRERLAAALARQGVAFDGPTLDGLLASNPRLGQRDGGNVGWYRKQLDQLAQDDPEEASRIAEAVYEPRLDVQAAAFPELPTAKTEKAAALREMGQRITDEVFGAEKEVAGKVVRGEVPKPHDPIGDVIRESTIQARRAQVEEEAKRQ